MKPINSHKSYPKSAKSQHYSLSRQNSVIFCTDFTQARKFFTWTLFMSSYVYCISAPPYKKYSINICVCKETFV